MMRVGFIGLGRMGGGMAANLAKSSHDVMVYDAYEPATRPFAERGTKVAGSLQELVEFSEVIFSSLPGPAEVEAVVLGEDGILSNAAPGTAYFDVSSNSPETVKHLSARLAEAGITMLDSPVSGGPDGAAAGTLVLWIGGDRATFERFQPVLDEISSVQRLLGDVGAGTVAKLCNNLLGNMILVSVAEVFTLGAKAGLDPLDLWEALQFGIVGKWRPLDHAVKQFLPNRYDQPKMQLKLGKKDIGLAVRLGQELGIPLKVADLVDAQLEEAVELGYGDLDSRAVMKVQVERAGVEIQVDPERLKSAVQIAADYHRGG